MWQCRKCGKPVYFAERKQSLGFDWHPNCLRCEECGKRLNPGQHAEHKGVPYCHHPCYGALFGPQLFGHGTRNECHTSFGKVENRDGQVKRSHLEGKLKAYNQYYEGKPGELKSREANGRMILEGVLRIYWGVRNVIHLKEEDDQRTIAVRRRSTVNSTDFYSDNSDDEDPPLWREETVNGWSTPQSPSTPVTPGSAEYGRSTVPFGFYSSLERSDSNSSNRVLMDMSPEKDDQHGCDNAEGDTAMNSDSFVTLSSPSGDYSPSAEASSNLDHASKNENSFADTSANDSVLEKDASFDEQKSRKAAVKTGSTAIRRRPGRRMNKARVKRRCSINGHFYLRETSSFTPPHGSACSVWVTSLVTVEEVLNMLLEKYKVEMSSKNFALFVIKDNGERRRIKDEEYPLITRVMLGPHEEVAKIFIVDAQQTEEISPQVAQFLNLSLAECRAILLQYEQEEMRQIHALRQKYEDMAYYIQRRMKELRGV
ncbi:ras association domain-containing protein 4-like [Macrobrachium nipponense]|uniref:ras association domain-containing protein 4-like n=1 Tax=Macrobrachium nipponense TaxID=159736 RepID=UPI0030C8A493